jgi:hypothetical protein
VISPLYPGWWFQPLWKIWVNGKDDIPYILEHKKKMFETTNQYPMICPIQFLGLSTYKFYPHYILNHISIESHQKVSKSCWNLHQVGNMFTISHGKIPEIWWWNHVKSPYQIYSDGQSPNFPWLSWLNHMKPSIFHGEIPDFPLFFPSESWVKSLSPGHPIALQDPHPFILLCDTDLPRLRKNEKPAEAGRGRSVPWPPQNKPQKWS